MSRPSPLVMPNQVRFTCQNADGPLAHPVAIPFGTPEGMGAMVFGGLSKEASLAGMIVSAVADDIPVDMSAEEKANEIARQSLNIAEAILAEDARRKLERQQEAVAAAQEQEGERQEASEPKSPILKFSSIHRNK